MISEGILIVTLDDKEKDTDKRELKYKYLNDKFIN